MSDWVSCHRVPAERYQSRVSQGGDRITTGRDERVIAQFGRISRLSDDWDHNRHYHDFLLRQVPQGCRRVLDVGCGTGELSYRLAALADDVVGIDVAPDMIAEARLRYSAKSLSYLVASVEEYLEQPGDPFDLIISVAALHHMDHDAILRQMRQRLTATGRIVILDLVEDRGPTGLLLSLAAALLNPCMYLIKTGRLGPTAEKRAAWQGHAQYDRYLSTREARATAKRVLGQAEVRRHLFWRYSLVYENCGYPG